MTEQDTKDNIGASDTTRNILFLRNKETVFLEENSTIIKTNTIGHSFVLGHSVNGVLGSPALGVDGIQVALGDQNRTLTLVRVVNPDNKFREHFRDVTFKDTDETNTADWNITLFRLAMTTATDQGTIYNTIATSKTVFTNDDEIVITATVSADETKAFANDQILYFLSADGGVTYEAVTIGIEHQFINTGTDLRFKIMFIGNGANLTFIENLKVNYIVNI